MCRGGVAIPSIVIWYSQGSPYSAIGVLAAAATTSRLNGDLENTIEYTGAKPPKHVVLVDAVGRLGICEVTGETVQL